MEKEANLYAEIVRRRAKGEERTEAREGIRLGETIRRLRERAGLSGAELCRRSGRLDPRTLTAIEKGRIRNPSLASLQAVAQGLGCLVCDLFIPAEMELDRNFYVGSQKGVFQIKFPKLGLKIVSTTPPTVHFFCGKLILDPRRKVTGDFLKRPTPLFVEVVMGHVEFSIEGETVRLEEGENLFFNGGFRHTFRNLLNRESAFWLVTAPSFLSGFHPS